MSEQVEKRVESLAAVVEPGGASDLLLLPLEGMGEADEADEESTGGKNEWPSELLGDVPPLQLGVPGGVLLCHYDANGKVTVRDERRQCVLCAVLSSRRRSRSSSRQAALPNGRRLDAAV